MADTRPDAAPGEGCSPDRAPLEQRVHVDLPRVRPEDMVTTQQVDPPPDPEGGRNPEMEFTTRHAGW